MNSRLAVIFDMDGVLVDSFHAHRESWQKVTAQRGLSMTDEQFAATFGRTSREIIVALWPERGFDDRQIDDFDRQKEAAYRGVITAQFPAMPGALALLERLHAAGFALGVGSSGPPENVDLALQRLGKRDLFGAVVTGADVEHGKPDPAVFRIAGQRLGVPPSSCVVVEDADLGVEAAHRAGMAAIGLASTGRTRQSLAAAELVIDSLGELMPERVRQVVRDRPCRWD